MNELIKRVDLAELMGVSDSTLRKALSKSRKQLIPSEKKGYINILLDENKTYIINNCSQRGIDIETTLYNKLSDPIKKESIEETTQVIDDVQSQALKPLTEPTYTGMTQSDLTKIKIKKEIDKLDIDTKLKNLEHAKKKAKVLPIDFVTEWSSRNIRGVFGNGVNFGDTIIEQICNELDASIQIKLKYKKMFKSGFGEIVDKGIKSQEPEALNYAKEYALANKW